MSYTDFLVTLPSNSNMSTHPANEPANYTVRLSEPLNLDGEWEAALVSVQYTPTWLTFSKTQTILYLSTEERENLLREGKRPDSPVADFVKFRELLGKHGLTKGQIIRQLSSKFKVAVATLYAKYYESVVSLGQAICKAVNDVMYHDGISMRYEYDYGSKRGHFICSGGEVVLLLEDSTTLGDLLGHRPDWIPCDKCSGVGSSHQRVDPSPHYFTLFSTSDDEPKLSKVNSLWVYSNITQYQQVGDTKAPLLGIVPTKNTTGERIHYTVNPIYFLALKNGYIPEITIQITDDKGKRVPFATGNNEDNLICCLRFRRRKSLMPI
jgi:hypothetical protein